MELFWTGKKFVNKFTPIIWNPKPPCKSCGHISKKPPGEPCDDYVPTETYKSCKNWEEF